MRGRSKRSEIQETWGFTQEEHRSNQASKKESEEEESEPEVEEPVHPRVEDEGAGMGSLRRSQTEERRKAQRTTGSRRRDETGPSVRTRDETLDGAERMRRPAAAPAPRRVSAFAWMSRVREPR